ncbi:hypothetical protein B0H10DRAFT_1940755 [Mycena sp. CBHHK59/15]|nr:hypothetical protein B0H10DRAFT_1940755 [Mycena sp. CBHHK59/15]
MTNLPPNQVSSAIVPRRAVSTRSARLGVQGLCLCREDSDLVKRRVLGMRADEGRRKAPCSNGPPRSTAYGPEYAERVGKAEMRFSKDGVPRQEIHTPSKAPNTSQRPVLGRAREELRSGRPQNCWWLSVYAVEDAEKKPGGLGRSKSWMQRKEPDVIQNPVTERRGI